jgi:hypothetical protein
MTLMLLGLRAAFASGAATVLSRHAAASMSAALPTAQGRSLVFRFMILFSLVWFLLLMLAQDINPPTDLIPATIPG